MKKILAFLLAVAMLACLCACGAKPGTNGPTPAKSESTTATTAGTTTEAPTTTTTFLSDCPTLPPSTTETSAPETTAATTTMAPTSTTTGAPSTTATKAPTTTTTTTVVAPNAGNVPKSIKILSVGNSFSVDAMRHHLYQMFEAAGCTDIRLGILYIGGCSIDKHYECLRRDSASYQYQENVNGTWTYTDNYKASDAFALTDWDIVTVQQVSSQSGRGISYENLSPLMELIRPQIGDAKVYWHMTWAYQQGSDHPDFPNYNNDQMRMYKGIVRATTDKILPRKDMAGFFPCGTAIQNLRTSSLGDTLTSDGHHLSDTYGDYTAALTWFCYLTGAEAASMAYRPLTILGHFDEIAESVDNAIKTPLAITECE